MSSEPTVVLTVPSSIMVRQLICFALYCYVFMYMYAFIVFACASAEQAWEGGGESEEGGGGLTERAEVGAVLRCEGGL